MKLVTRDEMVAGEYYMIFESITPCKIVIIGIKCPNTNHVLGQMMFRHAEMGIEVRDNDRWAVYDSEGTFSSQTIYELNDDDIHKHVIMETI